MPSGHKVTTTGSKFTKGATSSPFGRSKVHALGDGIIHGELFMATHDVEFSCKHSKKDELYDCGAV
jgi:hypothetical protein